MSDNLSPSNKKIDPFSAWTNSVRAKLVEEIMRQADFISSEGSLEKAEGMYDVGKYILTGSWEW